MGLERKGSDGSVIVKLGKGIRKGKGKEAIAGPSVKVWKGVEEGGSAMAVPL
jgi:hypothetical protein